MSSDLRGPAASQVAAVTLREACEAQARLGTRRRLIRFSLPVLRASPRGEAPWLSSLAVVCRHHERSQSLPRAPRIALSAHPGPQRRMLSSKRCGEALPNISCGGSSKGRCSTDDLIGVAVRMTRRADTGFFGDEMHLALGSYGFGHGRAIDRLGRSLIDLPAHLCKAKDAESGLALIRI
jgi:hypothetical protein